MANIDWESRAKVYRIEKKQAVIIRSRPTSMGERT